MKAFRERRESGGEGGLSLKRLLHLDISDSGSFLPAPTVQKKEKVVTEGERSREPAKIAHELAKKVKRSNSKWS